MTPPSVQVRPWHLTDVPELARLANNRRIWSQLRDAFPHPYTEESARSWVTFSNSQPTVTHFAIVAESTLVGGIGYIPGHDVERVSAEVGYWIGEPYWGRGLACAALRLLVDSLSTSNEFTRLFALTFAQNAASRRVLEKVGFQFDATLRRSAIKDGVVMDQCLYSYLVR